MNRALVPMFLALAGCDWANTAFLNSIPLEGVRTDDMHVYIAYDGLAPSTVRDAVSKGAFAGPDWKTSRFITNFPGSSDSSWTRILRIGSMHGYEYEYYDPDSDSLVNAGLVGLAKHILPAFSETLSYEAEYQRAWDYRSHGYSHNFEVYSDTWLSLEESLDDMFFQLDGRAQTGNAFLGYFMEGDVLGHTGNPQDCTRLLVRLAERIEQFRKAHPRRKFHFTILSDHGMDFTPMLGSHFLDYNDEFPKAGITPVTSLRGLDPAQGVYAVAILHVRMQYLAMHTLPEQVREVGRRASEVGSIDFAAGRLGPSRFALWTGGRLDGTFEHSSGGYVLEGDFTRYGVPAGVTSVSDAALFAMTKGGDFPDLFYRVRTALSKAGAEHPADVILSSKSGWQSRGAIPPPGANALVTGGVHGGAGLQGIGSLVTDERDLPDAVRADAFLDLFPVLAQHLRDRGFALRAPDADARPR